MIPKAEKDSGWTIDFEFLYKLEKEINKKYNKSLALDEVECIILILIEKGYLKDI